MRTLLKTLLALLVAVGLAPLAQAHLCNTTEYSIDPAHRVPIYCGETFCIVTYHVCIPPMTSADAAQPEPRVEFHHAALP